MSHFTVLVIGDNVEQQLAPYHEFECTGTDDQYVKDIDVTDEYRKDYREHTTDVLCKLSDGTLHEFFDSEGSWRPEFSEPDPEAESWDKGRRRRFVPAGYEQVTVPTSQLQTFATFVGGWGEQKIIPFSAEPDIAGEHKYGYVLMDANGEVAKVIKRTNQSSKWDWYQIGGRWSGHFILKAGAQGLLGKRSLLDQDEDSRSPNSADVVRKGDIDIETMRDEAGLKAAKAWDRAAALHEGERWVPWQEMLGDKKGRDKIDEVRTAYHAQPPLQRMAADKEFNFWDGFDKFLTPREQYVQEARDRALTTYAVVYRGEWSGKGEMGWFGCDDPNMTQAQWNKLFNDLIDGLPDDTVLTIVDCHI